MLELEENNNLHMHHFILFSIGFIILTIEREKYGQGQFIFKELFKICFIVTTVLIIISPIKNSISHSVYIKINYNQSIFIALCLI